MPDELPPGTRLQEYEVIKTLGKGGFGITYLARDIRLGREVAIKEYFPVGFATRSGEQTISARSEQHVGDYRWGLDRFIGEARTLARFDHPSIVRVIQFFEANGSAYIVMEHIVGHSLSDELKEKQTLPEPRVKEIVNALLDGLEQTHAEDLLHRDIKPGNVMLREDGRPVLIDFGAARSIAGQHSRTMTAVLTPGYAPIEQYGSQGKQGPWTDIYSLGALAYKCLSGKTPQDATDRFRQDQMPRVTEVSSREINGHFAWAIDVALKVQESERPQAIAEWRHMMKSAQNGLMWELEGYDQSDPEILLVLIDAGADVNVKDEDGDTPLLYAVKFQSDLQVLQVLVDAGADVNKAAKDGSTPLHYAVCYDDSNPKIIQFLINAGADVNAEEEDGETPLHVAVQHNPYLEILQLLINAGADMCGAIADRGWPYSGRSRSLLRYSVEEDLPGEILKILVDAGADIDETVEDGRSLLRYMVQEYSGAEEEVRILINAGADVNECMHGQSLLHDALEGCPRLEEIQVLIDAGADVNAEDWEMSKPLHYAARLSSSPEILRFLTNAGAYVNATNAFGMTPLHYAARDSSNPETLKVLIDAGADVDASGSGQTLMHIDSDTEYGVLDPSSSARLAGCLENSGCRISDAIDQELMPMTLSCVVANKKVSDFKHCLSEVGNVWVNEVDEGWEGRTPLHYAASDNSNQEVLQTLIDAGADVNAKDECGQTPLDIAKNNPNPEIQPHLKSIIRLAARKQRTT